MTGDLVSAGIQGYQSFKLYYRIGSEFPVVQQQLMSETKIPSRAAMIENFSRISAIAELLSLPVQLSGNRRDGALLSYSKGCYGAAPRSTAHHVQRRNNHLSVV